MSLVDLDLVDHKAELPDDVRAFLHEAGRRIEQFQGEGRCPGFVPSNFERVHGALRTLKGGCLTRRFCEWGSGFGVVASLAAMLGFDACGIEIEEELVDAARRLAGDFDLSVQLVHGSFIPRQSATTLATGNGFDWLNTDRDTGLEALGIAPADFDVVFAYPWPDEQHMVASLFEEHAESGAVLLTYHGDEELRLRRKVERRRRGCSRRAAPH
jgi:hypothetical protein